VLHLSAEIESLQHRDLRAFHCLAAVRLPQNRKVGPKFCSGSFAESVTRHPPLPVHLKLATTPPKIRVTPEQPDTSATLDGERKTVTALFADINALEFDRRFTYRHPGHLRFAARVARNRRGARWLALRVPDPDG